MSHYSAPFQVYLGITYKCNLSCPHCYSKGKDKKEEMSYEEIKDIIDQIAKMSVFKIIFSHGENILHNKFFDIANYMKSKGLHVTLITNGIAINQKKVKRLSETKIDKAFVSIDSTLKSVHDKFRGFQGAWEKALNSIDLFLENGIGTSIAVALSRVNYKEIEKMINLGLQKKVNEISFMTVRPSKTNFNYLAIPFGDYQNAVDKLWQFMVNLKGKMNIVFHDPLALKILHKEKNNNDFWEWIVGQNSCFAGKTNLSITPDGNVLPCNFMDYVVGNIREKPLADIWKNSPILLKLRSDFTPLDCLQCKIKLCSGGCKAFSFNFYSDISKRDPRCKGGY